MQYKALKYLLPLLIYIGCAFAFTRHGILTWLPMIYAWIIIPVLELLIPADSRNMSQAEEDLAKHNRLYDAMLYLIVVMQYAALYFFLKQITEPGLLWWETLGRIMCMGLLCGTFGINVGHELGHRNNKTEQVLAKMLLATSLYMHFFIEHNKGHHKHVATPNDPSSARLNEPVFLFYFRTIILSYVSAWHIANDEAIKKTGSKFNIKNEMIQVHIGQLLLLAAIYFSFGMLPLLYFLCSALVGILLLETVNYIEHYGLQRREITPGKFERAMPQHSWNSNHVLGRMMLFELSRHSDHHYLASRKYQILKHHDDAPQLPTGYPGSMILALLPPLWFAIMNKRIEQLNHPRKTESNYEGMLILPVPK
ncbi:MAG: alkane 1-monooxygenase [Ferruginibacter sp.]